VSGNESDEGKARKDLLEASFYKTYADQPKFELPPFQCTGESEYKLCLSPRQALARYDLSPSLAMLQLNRELLANLVQAVALKALWNDTDQHGTSLYAVVPYWVWRKVTLKEDSDFWDTGFLETHFPGEDYNYQRWAQLFGVRFWPDGLPQTVENGSHQQAASKPKGGAPRKDWWDLLWIEMIRRIQDDSLHPESAAALERTMLEWLATQGVFPGDSTLKRTASNLFRYLRE
jgi:hypothetical protein